MRRIVVASGNPGKLAEFNQLLGGSGVEFIAQGELGVEDIEETGLSFVENALLKARHAARVTGLPALADDSGICVDALDGAPGLYSARYAGEPSDAKRNIEKLLAKLAGLPDHRRGAHFHCTLVLLRHPIDPRPLVAEGEWHGRILEAPRGDGGFGYDPVFFDPGLGKAAAELPPEVKNRISHRGLALAELKKRLVV
ncbi:RdgB/HAM1 family non-canonical purine NTP pyrophosphatase [Marilutibacter alkalisoli]|uniref:dITP/XTP pyrophosphatase n=1 Tax=Marilutibacter alkalisoli TaxID=2591633 RepID=A0A514BWF7_9GAMM|nr:RdgB/HAM1 family non-canonical purine NTP pyrophosphatase [Lysobacter alkalisoli]QDH71672.1 RdgB/HAM1 family non-canonical purine NTP pyrophosphatase [Lysobacter alkalisoli]